MDPGNLVKIVFIAHLLLVSLLFKSFPLHLGFSLNSSAWPWDLAPTASPASSPRSPPHSHGCLTRASMQSAFPLRLLTQAVPSVSKVLPSFFAWLCLMHLSKSSLCVRSSRTLFYPLSQSKLDPKRPVFLYKTLRAACKPYIVGWAAFSLGCKPRESGLCTLCLLLHP